jgi:hypothetical protein
MGRRERQQAGFEKAKKRAQGGNEEMEKFMEKGRNAGRPGAPKLTRKDIARAKRIERES